MSGFASSAALVLLLVDRDTPGLRWGLLIGVLAVGLTHAATLLVVAHLTQRGFEVRSLITPLADIVLITLAVLATGGQSSMFFVFYYPATVAAALRFGRRRGLLMATLYCIAYLGGLAWDHGGWHGLAHFDLALRVVAMFILAAMSGGFHAALASRMRVLADTRRMRDEFLMVASHELKTPLVSIRGISQVLDRVVKDGSTEQALLRRVDAAVDRMQRLIRDLSDAARVDAGTLSLEKSAVDLNALARDAVEEARLGNPRRELKFRGADQPLRVEVDPQRLLQVLGNLLSNALKFTAPDRGPVIVGVRREGREAWVSVRDPGLGIPVESLPLIFEKHGRSPTTPPLAFAGLGLGLYLARAIVLAHDGTIHVTSTEGHGSDFVVKLKLAPPATGVSSPGQGEPGAAAPEAQTKVSQSG
ncbi:MAG: HAMP domain-containing histidine kinase [Deltaproteobacteria bacterium]|nr:HAMP domain-containing histidine kinase [Deltaproteobacteria bacterium]